MTQTLRIEDERVRGMLKGVRLAAEDMRPAWREFAQYMRVQTDRTFDKLRLGGSFRGVHWKYFSPQYTRKDGTVVQAWGGIKKDRGKGLVKGRLRPSGQRVKQGDAIMQDTKTMRNRAALTVRQTANELALGPQGVLYAAAQNRSRRFLFFHTPRDAAQLGKILGRHIQMRARREGQLKQIGLPSAFSRIRR